MQKADLHFGNALLLQPAWGCGLAQVKYSQLPGSLFTSSKHTEERLGHICHVLMPTQHLCHLGEEPSLGKAGAAADLPSQG